MSAKPAVRISKSNTSKLGRKLPDSILATVDLLSRAAFATSSWLKSANLRAALNNPPAGNS